MRFIETQAAESGVSTDSLIRQSGLAVARRVRHHLGHLIGVNIVVLVGSGNNGKDGLAAAQQLHIWGAHVSIFICHDNRNPVEILRQLSSQKVNIIHASADRDFSGLKAALKCSNLVIDSVLGTGCSRSIVDPIKGIFSEVNEAKANKSDLLVLAVDIPSGLHPDTGEMDPATMETDITVTLGYPKIGLFAFPGAGNVGKLEIANIGIPQGLDEGSTLELMSTTWAKTLLPVRPKSAYKGDFGRTLIIAGSQNYIGAAVLAASAATRVGTGLVCIATPGSLIPSMAPNSLESTYLPLPETAPGIISMDAASVIFENLSKYDSLLIGCGMGNSPAARHLVEQLLFSNRPKPPTIIDADGLNILSSTKNWWKKYTDRAIITPHSGEMARLLGDNPPKNVSQSRAHTAIKSAIDWNKITVLKGAHTIVAYPNGSAFLSPFSNPGLASAGTGDVLAGVIAGLLSQISSSPKLNVVTSAALGVYLHGRAGEQIREEIGDTGMIASDLLPVLPRIIKKIRSVSCDSINV
jgi:hydroxyethylthiazole kinase-like uncharacterized protein yjeF